MGRRLKWILALLVIGSTAFAGTVRVPGMAGDIQIAITSFQERQYQTILRQQHDYSCGSAALASLLSFHYDSPISEKDVFDAMLARADAEKVRREGFSMLDMKNYLETRGYTADGFRLPLESLRTDVAIPMIVLMNIDGFRHFVVLKGMDERNVLIGDPARGLKAYSRAEFESAWDGIAFVIRNHLDKGRATFNRQQEWARVATAPLTDYAAGGAPELTNLYLQLPMGLDW